MNGTEKVVKHLEMIEVIINRLEKNSFWIKSGSLAILLTVALLVARGPIDQPDVLSLIVLILIILGFWTLDGYFLWKEQLFQQLYEEVRQQTDTDFNMDVSKHKTNPKCSWASTIFSVTLIVFYTIEIVFALFVTRCLLALLIAIFSI